MYSFIPCRVVQCADGENGDYDGYADWHYHQKDAVGQEIAWKGQKDRH